jgi:hypothetical protein
MLGYVIVAVINKKIPLINTSVLRFPTHTHMALEKGGEFSDHFFILNVISSLHANPQKYFDKLFSYIVTIERKP